MGNLIGTIMTISGVLIIREMASLGWHGVNMKRGLI